MAALSPYDKIMSSTMPTWFPRLNCFKSLSKETSHLSFLPRDSSLPCVWPLLTFWTLLLGWHRGDLFSKRCLMSNFLSYVSSQVLTCCISKSTMGEKCSRNMFTDALAKSGGARFQCFHDLGVNVNMNPDWHSGLCYWHTL